MGSNGQKIQGMITNPTPNNGRFMREITSSLSAPQLGKYVSTSTVNTQIKAATKYNNVRIAKITENRFFPVNSIFQFFLCLIPSPLKRASKPLSIQHKLRKSEFFLHIMLELLFNRFRNAHQLAVKQLTYMLAEFSHPVYNGVSKFFQSK